ncbi:uncharacterized protein [Typha latifolia]|uniref:uncharacterized protein n=1 Tax=Typha latifolia TaxID=4733 RepID=UPI003C2EF2A9
MGNTIGLPPIPCLGATAHGTAIKLVFWGGPTELLPAPRLAGEVMFEYPDRVVCRADSFYIGLPVPVMSMDDPLLKGHTYFLLPVDRFPCHLALTVASLALLSPATTKKTPPAPSLVGSGRSPFEYVKWEDGRTRIRVLPEFIAEVMRGGEEEGGRGSYGGSNDNKNNNLCSTPELRKQYEQLVVSRERAWSPRLETIEESKRRKHTSIHGRLSPVRLLGLERRTR